MNIVYFLITHVSLIKFLILQMLNQHGLILENLCTYYILFIELYVWLLPRVVFVNKFNWIENFHMNKQSMKIYFVKFERTACLTLIYVDKFIWISNFLFNISKAKIISFSLNLSITLYSPLHSKIYELKNPPSNTP